jgi:hypothetical protein
MSRRVVVAPDGMKADSVYKAEIAVAANIQSFGLDIVAHHAYSNGANARSASFFVSDIRCA